MAWGMVGSAAISAVGGYLSSKNSAPKTPKYRPYDVTTGLGTADYDRKNKRVDMTLSPEQQAFADRYNQMATQYLSGGGPTAGFQGFSTGAVQNAIPGLFGGALDASITDQGSLDAYLGNISGLGGAMGNMYGAANTAGLNALGGPAPGSAQANQMFGLGQRLMGQNYNDVFNNRLGLLRQQAQPFEDRASDAFLGRQQAMGRMDTTGGARDTEAFARGLSQADTTRQLDAMNLSEALYGRDQSAGLNAMGTGMQGLISGYGTQGQVGQGLLGLGQNIGSSLGNLYGAGLNASQGYNDLTNARAQQRMQNAMSLFGFGNTLGQQDIQTGSTLQGIPMSMYQQLMGQAQLGNQIAGTKMSGQVGGAQNPGMAGIGGMLGGFGNATMGMGGLGALFGGGSNIGLTPAQTGGAFSGINSSFGGNYLSGMI